MTSDHFERFKQQYIEPFEPVGSRKPLDPDIFQQLSSDELQEAEQLLLARVGVRDGRAAVGLGMIGSQEGAIKLKMLLPSTGGEVAIQTSLALWRIEKAAVAVDTLIKLLQGSKRKHSSTFNASMDRNTRMDAAIALREIPLKKVSDALLEALREDTEYLVRYHCAASLMTIHDLPAEESNRLLQDLAPKLSSRNAQVRQQAVEAILESIKARPL